MLPWTCRHVRYFRGLGLSGLPIIGPHDCFKCFRKILSVSFVLVHLRQWPFLVLEAAQRMDAPLPLLSAAMRLVSHRNAQSCQRASGC